jgi:hypothetical protein
MYLQHFHIAEELLLASQVVVDDGGLHEGQRDIEGIKE